MPLMRRARTAGSSLYFACRMAPAARSVQYCEVSHSRTAFRIPLSIFSASLPGALLGVVADQDRLTQRDARRRSAATAACAAFGVVGALVAVLLEPVGPLLGAFDE